MISIRVSGHTLFAGLTLIFLVSSIAAFAEYPPQQQGYGSYPFTGGQYPQSQPGGGGGAPSSSSAKYEKSSDVNELKESGPEYAKQAAEAGTKTTEGMVDATKEVVSSIGNSKLEETEVSEAVVKASESVSGAMSAKGTNEIVDRLEKDALAIAKTWNEKTATETKEIIAAMAATAAKNQEQAPVAPTMGEFFAARKSDATLGSAARDVNGSPLGQLMNADPLGNTVTLSQIPNREPASHAMTQQSSLLPNAKAAAAPEAAANPITSFERGMLHNPPTGF